MLGHQQLHEIERVNRNLKHTVDVRPVYHCREDRIREHVLLCWVSRLPIRLIETRSEPTWHHVKQIMRPLSLAYQHSEHGHVIQTNRVSRQQKSVLDVLELKPPARFLELPTSAKTTKRVGTTRPAARAAVHTCCTHEPPILGLTGCRARGRASAASCPVCPPHSVPTRHSRSSGLCRCPRSRTG